MGLVFHLICLFFTLFVLQSYVSSGFHAREHRLLPLVLGLIALNSFYRITYYVTGEAQTLRILTIPAETQDGSDFVLQSGAV